MLTRSKKRELEAEKDDLSCELCIDTQKQDSDICEPLQSTPAHISEQASLVIPDNLSPVNTTGHSDIWEYCESVCMSSSPLPTHLSFLDSSLSFFWCNPPRGVGEQAMADLSQGQDGKSPSLCHRERHQSSQPSHVGPSPGGQHQPWQGPNTLCNEDGIRDPMAEDASDHIPPAQRDYRGEFLRAERAWEGEFRRMEAQREADIRRVVADHEQEAQRMAADREADIRRATADKEEELRLVSADHEAQRRRADAMEQQMQQMQAAFEQWRWQGHNPGPQLPRNGQMTATGCQTSPQPACATDYDGTQQTPGTPLGEGPTPEQVLQRGISGMSNHVQHMNDTNRRFMSDIMYRQDQQLDLMGRMAERQSERAHRGASSDMIRALASPPDCFTKATVHRSVKQFLEEYNVYTGYMNAPDMMKFEGLSKYLKGEALAFYKQYRLRNTCPRYNDFEMAFEKEFSQLAIEELHKGYAYRRQGPTETVSSYSDDMIMLLMSANVPVDMQVQFYIANLRPMLAKRVAMDEPQSLKEAKKCALKQELCVPAEKSHVSVNALSFEEATAFLAENGFDTSQMKIIPSRQRSDSRGRSKERRDQRSYRRSSNGRSPEDRKRSYSRGRQDRSSSRGGNYEQGHTDRGDSWRRSSPHRQGTHSGGRSSSRGRDYNSKDGYHRGHSRNRGDSNGYVKRHSSRSTSRDDVRQGSSRRSSTPYSTETKN